ncbi:hypothetical protein ES707_11734 [subsurface metagenome]
MIKNCLRLFVVLVLFLASLGVVSCGGGGSPEAVVKDFFTAINNGEFDKAESYIYPSVFAPDISEYSSNRLLEGNIEKVEILDAVTGTAFGTKMASVKVKLTISPALSSTSFVWHQETTKNITLEKTDQGWKISTML